MTKKALYLAGGGARGAYQAGALKAIAQILDTKQLPFDVISSVSAGCLNAAVLAEQAENFPAAAQKLVDLWEDIHSNQIFSTSNYALSKSLLGNLSSKFFKNNQSGFLLDTKPLRTFIEDNLDFDTLNANIRNGSLEAMEIISQCYETRQTCSFYQHNSLDFQDWYSLRHKSERVDLASDHVLASSALPLFFPPVPINGLHYGDGSVGLIGPLRGAIRFKVDKILILGTKQALLPVDLVIKPQASFGMARVLGSLLTSLFLDNLEQDIDMVNRMNEIAGMVSIWKKRRSPWRPIETLYLRPTQNVASIAQSKYHSIPRLLRFVLNFLGAQSPSGDLLSFLLFEKEFTRELTALGYTDTMAVRDTVLKFFKD